MKDAVRPLLERSHPCVSNAHSTSHWEEKYRVKYKVRRLMEELMEGPVGCSTPRPGVNGISAARSVVASNGPPWDVEALMKRVVAELNQEEKELVERYVFKYFFKLKLKKNF